MSTTDLIDQAELVSAESISAVAAQRVQALKQILAEQVLILKEIRAVDPDADTEAQEQQIATLLKQIDTTSQAMALIEGDTDVLV